MAIHGWADWARWGVAGSPERATVSVVPRAASWWLPVLWWQAMGHRSGCAHFPAGAPNAGASPLVNEGGGMEGGPSQRAKPLVKGHQIKTLPTRLDFMHRLFWFTF